MRRLHVMAIALVLLVTTSCADANAPELDSPAPAPVASASDSVALGLVDLLPVDRVPILRGLLVCDVLEADRVQQWVGPAGGTVKVGPHALVIPRGALDRRVLITAELPGDSVSSVRFSPEGLRFERPAVLSLSYGHCPLVRSILPKRVAYTTDGLRILEWLRSIDNLFKREVSAPIDHFSKYAVAY